MLNSRNKFNNCVISRRQIRLPRDTGVNNGVSRNLFWGCFFSLFFFAFIFLLLAPFCHFFVVFLSLLTHRVRDYYFVCAIGGQHDGHLPFWLPGFVKFIMLKLYVFVCIAEINIPLLFLFVKRPPQIQLVVLGSAVSSSSEIWDRASTTTHV